METTIPEATRVDTVFTIAWARENPELFGTQYNEFFQRFAEGWTITSSARLGFLTLIATRNAAAPAPLNDEQRKWAEAVLSNDEASTDEELADYFVGGGMDRAQAVAAVARRNEFLNQDLNNAPRL